MPFIDETIVFERTSYPSAGCFFLNAEQLRTWVDAPAFRDRDTSYMSPLDSAATLSIMKTFRIYKPVLDQASFLEVLHASPRWVQSVAQWLAWSLANDRLKLIQRCGRDHRIGRQQHRRARTKRQFMSTSVPTTSIRLISASADQVPIWYLRSRLPGAHLS